MAHMLFMKHKFTHITTKNNKSKITPTTTTNVLFQKRWNCDCGIKHEPTTTKILKPKNDFYTQCLENNQKWVKERVNTDENYFKRLSTIQKPKILWIGCADSRVPSTDLIGMQPGDIFEHRNVANIVVHSDMNVMSVIQYALEALQVEDIIVCGHYNCGGVRHASTKQYSGIINKWLLHLKDVYDKHAFELDSIDNEQQREDRLVELNVIEQCVNVCQTGVVQKTWKNKPRVHGWVYDVRSGIIKDLRFNPELHRIYQLDFDL